MTIVKLQKYLFLGAQQDIDDFFERAQQQGFIEFLAPHGKKPVQLPAAVQTLLHAIKVLRKLPVKKSYHGIGGIDEALRTAERILTLKVEIEKLHEEERLITAEIARVTPFGDFSREEIDSIEREGNRRVQFFCMKTEKASKLADIPELIYIDTVYDLDYFMSISPEPLHFPDMIEMRIDRPLGELQHHLHFVRDSLHLLEAELKGFGGHLAFLQGALTELYNQHHLAVVKEELTFPLGSKSLFAVEGYVPEDKTAALYSLLGNLSVHVEPIALDQDEVTPTCMENSGLARVGEDLVLAYDVPASKDKDPSRWVFWAFAIFFSMIVSDAGYGLLFLGVAIFLHYKLPALSGVGKRMLKLFFVLSCGCIVWGVLSSSYFGLDLSPEDPLARYSPVGYLVEKKADYHVKARDQVWLEWVKRYPQVRSSQSGKEMMSRAVKEEAGMKTYVIAHEFKDNIFLELSLLVGIIHISISLLRYLLRHWAALGWVVFLIGGYLFFPSMLKATSLIHFLGWIDLKTGTQFGLQLIYGGIGLAVLLGLIQKRMNGLTEIMKVIEVFADVLSYLRLYALSLAGLMMASTFNMLGMRAGLAVGVVIIFCGHLVNITMTMMAGVIHGLRLNFIEWYHYSFQGGGRLFNPLRRLKSH